MNTQVDPVSCVLSLPGSGLVRSGTVHVLAALLVSVIIMTILPFVFCIVQILAFSDQDLPRYRLLLSAVLPLP